MTTARWLAFAIWAAVAATAVFWGSRLFVATPQAPAHARPADGGRPPPADLARVLGRAPVVAPQAVPVLEAPSRFKLVGIAAPRAGESRGGVALIAVDDRPARAFRVGSAIEPGLVLQSVQPRVAMLGPRGEAPQVKLELPALPAANTGQLPAAAGLSADGNFPAPVLPGIPQPGVPGAPGMLPRPTFSPPPNGMPNALPNAVQVPLQAPPPTQPAPPPAEAPEGSTN